MRRIGLWFGAVGFALFELIATRRWLEAAGSLGDAFALTWAHLWSDWFLLIVVADHLVIAGAALLWVWIDGRRRGWPLGHRLGWVAAFVGLGTPALLGYLAERRMPTP